jgi:hypothetical protein
MLILLFLSNVVVLSGENEIANLTMPRLRMTLLDMVDKDQAIRKEMVGNEEPSDQWLQSLRDMDESHTGELKNIFEKYGWLNASEIGRDGVQAFWLLAQHATDFDFQRALMPHIKEAFDEGKIEANSYALFVDRLLVREGKPQKYGTQIKEWVNKTPVPFPIENPDNVNSVRGNIGLFNLEDYLLLVKDAYFPEENTPLSFSDHELASDEVGIGLAFDIKGSGPMKNMTVKSFTVDRVKKGSTAANAGIAVGDRIIEIDGIPVEGSNMNRLIPAMDKSAGEAITLVVQKPDGKKDKVRVEVTAMSPE